MLLALIAALVPGGERKWRVAEAAKMATGPTPDEGFGKHRSFYFLIS